MTANRSSSRIRFALAHPLFSEKFKSEQLNVPYQPKGRGATRKETPSERFKRRLRDSKAKTRGGVWWRMSPYYAWFECLRRSEPYRKCCENGGSGPLSDLFVDFGDVFQTDFKEWWRSRGETLFGEPPSPKEVRSIKLSELEEFRSSIELEQTLLVCVPSGAKKEDAVRAFRLEIGKWKGTVGRGTYRKKGQSRAEQSKARYRPQSGSVINVGAILNDLRVLDLYRAAVGKSKWEGVGKEMRSVAKDRWRQEDDEKYDPETERIRVWRSRKNAEALIKNVEKGLFPIYAKRLLQ